MKLILLLLLLITMEAAAAVNPPVANGLIFHLDAASQRSGREALKLPQIGNNQPADIVFESSSNQLAAFQPDPKRRPTLMLDSDAAYFQFDGQDDYLLWLNQPRRELREMTLFILAAPKTNSGGFTGLFAATAPGLNDYTSGFNLDFGPAASKVLNVINVEAAGAGGFRDLLQPGFVSSGERPFRDFHVFTVRVRADKVETFLDGFKAGERERSDAPIGFSQVVVGGRIYSNDPSLAPFVQGFFDGAIAEVALFDRPLEDSERTLIEEYLLSKTVAANALLHGAKGHALQTVQNAPPVQMLVPGFEVEEMPVQLSNINNLRYRHDGKLVALGYNGAIYLLDDSDGDGLEDKSRIFWPEGTMRSPIGMALLPANDSRGDGIFVASKGKVSLILDKDRDGRGDEEIIVATGWNELTHGVDTLGLAVDPKDGSIYFGLGCANFIDAYQMNPATGRSGYSLADVHGTIQRVSADFSTRETICTGVRFTCALAFNRDGELFATDQEGATWLPNGNPLDELLHIQRGKHYGFPPRHPVRLPNVIDEPAVSEFGPQHQSTVGMVFNAGVNGGPHFGPAHWEGDAIVCGESRGKIWRTTLVRTPAGYTARNQLIACLGLLTVDACVSPSGDLLVACHSGPPDWGTGPAGMGRLFKVRYSNHETPQPVHAWASAPDEFRIAFDRPLDPNEWLNAREEARIEAGAHVGAGDRFETIRPGYQVVRDQMSAPRRWVEVLGLNIADDGRTLVLRLPRQSAPENYAITLPVPESWRSKKGIRQEPQMDFLVTLNGIQAVVSNTATEVQIVLPSGSLEASAQFTKGSAGHERFFEALRQPGAVLKLSTIANTANPYVPAIQPGARIDWNPDTDPFASRSFALIADYGSPREVKPAAMITNRFYVNGLAATNPAVQSPGLYLAAGDLRHLESPGRLLVPWSGEANANLTAGNTEERTDIPGYWLAGRRLFFGDLGCSTCHTIRGEGFAFGPDLSNLVFRDRDSVVKDIVHPSVTINPDHIGTEVKLKNGSVLNGLLRGNAGGSVKLALPAGSNVELARAEVESVETMRASLMPEGFGERLAGSAMEDLLAFLLKNPLEPAVITRLDPARPPGRKLGELPAVLTASSAGNTSSAPLHILLCSGPKDHGLDEHDYPQWLERWSRLLALKPNVRVERSTKFPTPSQLAAADVAVFFNGNPEWSAEKAAALDQFHQKGGGVVYLHYAVDGGKDPGAMAERAGLSFTLGSKFRHGEMEVVFKNSEHPISRGLPNFRLTDETYWNMKGDLSRIQVLAGSMEEGAVQPQLWTMERQKSRIVGCIPGHYSWTFDDPLYRLVVLRSICWAARLENPDALSELAVIGANIMP